MAYINQEQKKIISAKLKKVIPSTWKYTLSILHHSALVLKISQGDFTILYKNKNVPELDLNVYHLKNHFPLPDNNKLYLIFKSILDVMNDGNHDNSDINTDYFDVGWYNKIKIGHYDKPFKSLGNSQSVREFQY